MGKVSVALAGFLLLPGVVLAQSTIAGVVRDPSAAVFQASASKRPARRSSRKSAPAVTDGTGQYRITDLPPERIS
jgi:hypothetical protein